MTPDDRPGDGREQTGGLDDKPSSFHSRLLIRSRTGLPDYRQRHKMMKLAEEWGWLGQIAGQAAIFAAGLAIGGGIVLLRRGEPSIYRAAIIIGLGVGCMVFAIVGQLVARGANRRSASHARG
jgi:hypothetical protein